MLKPMIKKAVVGVPVVALSATLALTMVGCGGNGAQSGSGSGSDAAASQVEEQASGSASEEPVNEIVAQGGIEFPSYSIIPIEGWELTDRVDEKYEQCEFRRVGASSPDIFLRTFKTEPMQEAEARQGSKKQGVIDEVEINGVMWVRHTAPNGTINLFAKASSGKTVALTLGSQLSWEESVQMAERMVLK